MNVTSAGNVQIEFRRASRVFGEGKQAVRALGPVDLAICSGEFVSIMGPSGSGKSTLLTLASGIDFASHGQVLVQGRDLRKLRAAELAKLRRVTFGFVFQDLNLLPALTLLENVALPLELDGVPKREAFREASDQLELVGIAALARRYPHDVSGGERQRAAIARAFVGPRSILLADEPTGALDSENGEAIMQLLRQHCDMGRTIVVVTHSSTHAAWGDRIVCLRDGRIVDQVAEVSDIGNVGSLSKPGDSH
jgi:putative ABC transport system ATP-binding protein